MVKLTKQSNLEDLGKTHEDSRSNFGARATFSDSDSDSASVIKFSNPDLDPAPKFFKNPTPVRTPKTTSAGKINIMPEPFYVIV